MTIHLMRAPWDKKPVCGCRGKLETTFNDDKATCKLCLRSMVSLDRRSLEDSTF